MTPVAAAGRAIRPPPRRSVTPRQVSVRDPRLDRRRRPSRPAPPPRSSRLGPALVRLPAVPARLPRRHPRRACHPRRPPPRSRPGPQCRARHPRRPPPQSRPGPQCRQRPPRRALLAGRRRCRRARPRGRPASRTRRRPGRPRSRSPPDAPAPRFNGLRLGAGLARRRRDRHRSSVERSPRFPPRPGRDPNCPRHTR